MKLQEFIDANPWLEKCNDDFKTETRFPAFWLGSDCYEHGSGFAGVLELKEDTVLGVGFEYSEGCFNLGEEDEHVLFNKYFRNWKAPTKQENEMFAMLYGHALPWSEEQPFVWEE